MKPTRVGIIGLSASDDAWTPRTHGIPLKSQLSSMYQLTAIATTSKESAAASAKRWGIAPEKAYTSAEEIAKDPDVDMVVIGVKAPLHRELALPALRAGKDVFVEWPLATDMDQVHELQAAAQEGGGRTIVGLQARTSPAILKAKEIIDSGKLGKIVATTVTGWDNYLLYLPPRHDYEHDAKNRANISTITSGHVLDAFCYLLGEFESLNATTNCFFPEITTPNHEKPVSRDAPDAFIVQGKLQNGASVSCSFILTTPATPSSFTWIISGAKGSLKFEAANINIQIYPPKLAIYTAESKEWQEVPVDPPVAYGQVADLYQAVAVGEKASGSIVDFDGAAVRHSMLEASHRSSVNGTRESY